MRIDLRVLRNDPRAGCYRAFLDGVELPLCIMADEGAGEAVTVAHERTEGGVRIISDAYRRPIHIHHQGRVELRPIEDGS